MGKPEFLTVVDDSGCAVGDLGEPVGRRYLAMKRGNVTWFVPEELMRHDPLRHCIIGLDPDEISQIDLLP